MSQNVLNFTIEYEGKPEKPLLVTVYAFDERGELLASSKLERNQASLKLTVDQAKRARIAIAPSPPEKVAATGLTFDKMDRLHAFVPKWTFSASTQKYALSPIPQVLWKYWLWCKCQVLGKVVKKVKIGSAVQEWPVYMARVHICEVDPVWLVIHKLPNREILRLRDEIIKAIGKPIPIPPEPPVELDLDVFDPSPENIARSKMGLPIQVKASIPRVLPRRLVAKNLEIPNETKTALSSASVDSVRLALANNLHLIRPYFCIWPWIWPFFLRCDEVAVVLTDKQGKFSSNVWYLCAGDHPDLYFWVEYQLGSAWTTVYRPPKICHTFWNYTCGTEVTIPISDPRVPWYSDPTPMPGKQVAVLSIGHDVSIKEIKRSPDGIEEGLTTAGEPFGGSLEPTVWFGNDIAGSGISHYRWSYMRLTNADGSSATDVWHVIDRPVVRHYGEIWSDGTLVFKPFLLGPDLDIPGAALFKIPPANPPSNPGAISAAWAPQVDARQNTASAFFLSYLLEGGNSAEAAGKYALKLELFRYNSVSHVVSQVNLTSEGIALKIPTVDAPFGTGTVPTRAVPHDNVATPDMDDRVIRDATGKITAFRLVLHVDNNPCEAEIYPIKVTGATPGTWETVGTCGFIRYNTVPPAQILLSFKAKHPNNFARFAFSVAKGSTGYVNAACAPNNPSLTWTSLPMVKDTPVNGFSRDANSVYLKTMPVSTLVGACPNGTAAFAENLSVYPLATDGWTTLWYLSRYGVPTAFALQPKP